MNNRLQEKAQINTIEQCYILSQYHILISFSWHSLCEITHSTHMPKKQQKLHTYQRKLTAHSNSVKSLNQLISHSFSLMPIFVKVSLPQVVTKVIILIMDNSYSYTINYISTSSSIHVSTVRKLFSHVFTKVGKAY